MRGRLIFLFAGLFLCVLIEVCAHDILRQVYHKKLVSWLYFICGLLISIIPIIKISERLHAPIKISKYIFPIGVILIFVLAVPAIHTNYINHPIDYRIADMLPIMEIMNQRFLGGENPYKVIPEIWGGMQPIYLPAMWLPYSIASILDFDMRWVTFACLFLACLVLFIVNNKNQRPTIGLESVCLIPLAILIYSLAKVDIRLLVHSEEGIVILYYLLLASALYHRKLVLIAFALALCLMSRYSLVLWSAMFIFYIYYYHTKANALKLALYTIGFSLFLLVISRGILYIDVFVSLSSEYLSAIENPDNKFKYLPGIKENLGFAKFFRYEDLGILNKLFFVFSIVVPAGWLFFYHHYSEHINKRFFNLASLKMVLVFFYNFLIIPAQYLFYTSTFLSIAIMYFYFKEEMIYDKKPST